jgi:hypothetical protein
VTWETMFIRAVYDYDQITINAIYETNIICTFELASARTKRPAVVIDLRAVYSL